MKFFAIHRLQVFFTIVISFVVVVGFYIFLGSAPRGADAVISDGANATNLLGHIVSSTPVYTTATQDNGPSGDGFSGPTDVAWDERNGRVYVVDSASNRVLVYNLNGSNQWDEYTPDYVLGQPNFTTVTAGTTAAVMDGPLGVLFVSSTNKLFVSEYNNARILVFDVATIANGEAAENVLGQADFVTAGGSTAAGTLNGPIGMAYDSTSQRLFVADSGNHRVVVFDISTISDGESAVNVLGQANFVTADVGTTNSVMWGPGDVAYKESDNSLFVVDSDNQRVLVFDVTAISDGEAAVNVLGQTDFVTGNSGTTSSTFDTPIGVAYASSTSLLYVSDYMNSRVMIFDVSAITDGEGAQNVLGQSDFVTAGTSVSQSGLNNPYGLVTNDAGDMLYVADASAHRIMEFDVTLISDGENATSAIGQSDHAGSPVYTTDGTYDSPNAVGLYIPYAMVVDQVNHRLFVADQGNHRVLVFNLDSSNELVDYTADYVLGQLNFKTRAGDTTNSKFAYPNYVAYDAAGNRLFVSDGNNNRVLVFDVSSISNGEAAVNVLGQEDFVSSNSATTQTGLSSPRGLAYDSANNYLYVAESGNSRVMLFDVTAITDGEAAINVLGQPDFVTAGDMFFGVETNITTVDAPTALAYDSTNSLLFVAAGNQNRIMVFDVTSITDGENAVNVIGQADFTSSNGGTTQSVINGPTGLAFDSVNSRLFVSEANNSRVTVFDVASISNGENAINVLGQSDYVSAGNATTQSGFDAPYGIAYATSTGDLFVAEYTNNRVMVFDAAFANTVPVVSVNSATQKVDGSGTVDISVNVSDANNNSTRIKVAYATKVGGSCGDDETFNGDPTLDETASTVAASVGIKPDVTNANAYQVGTSSGIDTSSTNTVQFDWSSATDVTSTAGNYCLQFTPYDSEDGTAVYASVTLDNLDPTAPGSLSMSSTSTASAVLSFGATSTESNFTEYKIFYKAGSSGVTTGDTALTSSTDSNLGSVTFGGASTTTISSLSVNTQYVANIWAFDSYGNSASGSTELAFYTLANAPSSVAGTANSSSQITVTWGVNSNPSGTEFKADISTGTDCDYTADMTSCVFTGLSASTAYTITVSARNGDAVVASASGIEVTTSAASSSGGGGSVPIVSSSSGTAVQINNGAATTNNPDVLVSLNALLASYVALSEDPQFPNASFVPYNPTIPFTLSSGAGEKTVYVRFRSLSGFTTDASDSITLEVPTSTQTPSSSSNSNVSEPESQETNNPESAPESSPAQGSDGGSGQDQGSSEQSACALARGVYKSPSTPAVYFVSDQCTKRAFRQAAVYFTYFHTWDDVTVVPQSDINAISDDALGFMPWGPLWDPPYAPLAKTVDDPKVYIVSNGQRRWIETIEIFEALGYQLSWVEDVDSDWMRQFPVGDTVVSSDLHPVGTLIMYPGSPDVYVLEQVGAEVVKRHIVNESVFTRGGFRFDRVITIPLSEEYSNGDDIA